jgi:hypothetical protein
MFPVGEEKPVYENGCKLNLMVRMGGISRILCCYKYVKVVLHVFVVFSISLEQSP